MTFTFAKRSCPRCSGTGHYSFNGKHSVCYQCDGKREVLTVKAEKAYEAYQAELVSRLSKPVEEIVPGDAVWMKADGMMFKRTGYYVVLESEKDERVTLTFEGSNYVGASPGQKFRVLNVEITKQIRREIAAKYEDVTLTED